MALPADINLGYLTFHTMWLFHGLGLVYLLFIIWYEGKRDGFSTEKVLDVTFLSAGANYGLWVMLTRLYAHVEIYYYKSLLLQFDRTLFSFFVILCFNLVLWLFISRKRHWSFFHLIDIFSLGVSYYLQIVCVGAVLTGGSLYYLVLLVVLVLAHRQLFRYRGYLVFSGISFSALLLILTTLGCIVYHQKGYLLLYSAFTTISLVILYFRRKAAMPSKSLPKEFLDFVADKLKVKEKRLREEDRMLTEEDPYLQSGRADGNAEAMDEAILEDAQKELTDVKQSGIQLMLKQVKKALSFIRTGKYGTCEICGKPIDKARLQIFPEATRCLECSKRS
jgi:RNA polymerase-binding transcription factor DksA